MRAWDGEPTSKLEAYACDLWGKTAVKRGHPRRLSLQLLLRRWKATSNPPDLGEGLEKSSHPDFGDETSGPAPMRNRGSLS